MKKKIISAVLLTAVALGSASAFAADKDIVLTKNSQTAADEAIVGVPQITVDGNAVDLSKLNISQYMYTENGNTLVPLRTVAEKMGYKVDWNEADNSVSVNSDEWEIVLNIGVDSYYGVTKIKDAVGMTAPQTYGAAPKIIDDTTYVPAKMFELAGYNFSAVGQYASFTKAGADDNNAVQIPNPLVEYKSVDEAKSKLSFTAPTPSYVPDGYSISYVGTIAGDTLQIFYRNGENEMVFRVAEGNDDISGDHNVYKNIKDINAGKITAKYRENGESSGAVWTNGNLTFSIYADTVISEKDIINIISGIK